MSTHKCLEAFFKNKNNPFAKFQKVFANNEARETFCDFAKGVFVDKTIDVDENGNFYKKK